MKNPMGEFSDEALEAFHEAYAERIDKDKMPCNKPTPLEQWAEIARRQSVLRQVRSQGQADQVRSAWC